MRPLGTNQLELTASSLQTNAPYTILVRSNAPDAHWIGLTTILSGGDSSVRLPYNLSETGHAKELQGLTINNLSKWAFAIGLADDRDGNGLPDFYEDLVMRSDPYAGVDSYADPDGDGWSNIQEYQNSTDPLRFDQPPPPANLNVSSYTNGLTKVTWSYWTGNPDYFLVQKAQRTLRPGEGVGPFILQPPATWNKTNWQEYWAKQREIQRLIGRPYSRIHDAHYETGDYHLVAKIPGTPGQHDYSYTETNQPPSPGNESGYRIQAHVPVPPRAYLNGVNATTIRNTILPITTRQTTNGYDLTATRPIPYGWYLLLVRDRNNTLWRASGYFTAGTNRGSIHLRVDAKGMMHEGQGPVAMPEVKFLPDLVAPDFTAGWGEDSDGDGLPDIYEVLVTHTDPTNADTGNTGIVDGYKEPANDGWSNLEKFRRRADPFKPDSPPKPVVLTQPAIIEVMQACSLKTDLRYEPQVEIRVVGTAKFQPIQQSLMAFYQMSNSRDPYRTKPNFDLRVSWRLPQRHAEDRDYYGP